LRVEADLVFAQGKKRPWVTLELIILIVVLLLLFGGGYYWGHRVR